MAKKIYKVVLGHPQQVTVNPMVLSTPNSKTKHLGSVRHLQPLLLSIPGLVKAGEDFGLIMVEVEAGH